jgi:LysR family transcriptional regulator, transcriptional activator of the cysJI operon
MGRQAGPESAMLDAHQLNVFLAAATTLNFTAAARQLHMSQPCVSQHIRELEHVFDLDLFVREGRHVVLTDAGKALMPLAQQLIATSVRIEETMQSLKGDIYGHLVVGCSTTTGKYVLPFLLADFMRRHPRVEATCHVVSRPVALQMLADGDAHLALAGAYEFCSDVEYYKLLSDPLVLITHPDHPWAARAGIDSAELLEARFILREEGSGTRTAVTQGLIDAGLSIDQLPKVLTVGNSEAIALAVQEGIGVAFVSQLVVERLVPSKVAVVKVHDLSLRQDIYMGRNRRHPASVAQTAFWEFVRDPHNSFLRRFRHGSNGANGIALIPEVAVPTI